MADRRSSGGVIHDIGYRHYDGPRADTRAIALHLFTTGLRHAYGLGRSGRSKVLPTLLGLFTLAPAVVMVAMTALLSFDEPMTGYTQYTNNVQVLVSVFAAAQAPVLFSRDLRTRSIVLHLARPLSSAAFALVRWASLAAAIALFVVVPTVVLYAGALLAGADVGEQTREWLTSLPLALLLSCLLAAVTGVVSSVALRRGFAVVGSVVALLVVGTVVTSVQYITEESGNPRAGELAGLFSPWSLVNGLADVADTGLSVATPPEGPAMVTLYLVVALAVVAASLAFLVLRFATAGRR